MIGRLPLLLQNATKRTATGALSGPSPRAYAGLLCTKIRFQRIPFKRWGVEGPRKTIRGSRGILPLRERGVKGAHGEQGAHGDATGQKGLTEVVSPEILGVRSKLKVAIRLGEASSNSLGDRDSHYVPTTRGCRLWGQREPRNWFR